MKVFILGLDGLEHNFVEKWDLTHLKQRECGKVRVPINEEIHYPLTPEVWGTFLIGEHNIVNVESMHHPLAITLKLLAFLRKHINVSLGLGRKVRNKLPVKWWTNQYGIFLDKKTFLDLTDSKTINAPFYDNDCRTFEIMHRFDIGGLSLKQTVDALQKLYVERKKMFLSGIEKIQDEDVVFAYMHFPDILQHILFTRPSEIKKHYFDLNRYVSHLSSKLEDSTLFLIISDHGFNLETGMHSKHGFYSSNMTLNPKPTQITDFFQMIVQSAALSSIDIA